MGENNTQKMITYNEARLTVLIADIIIYEGLYFNLDQKPRFKKVLDLERTVSKNYQPPKRKLTPNDLLYVVHNHSMEIFEFDRRKV